MCLATRYMQQHDNIPDNCIWAKLDCLVTTATATKAIFNSWGERSVHLGVRVNNRSRAGKYPKLALLGHKSARGLTGRVVRQNDHPVMSNVKNAC